jgi:hypothetical protein
MSGTNVPSATFGPSGFIAPSEQAILTGREADILAAFNGTLNMALETPQGQIASSDTAIIGDCNNQFLALANGVDPRFATGRLQDGIGYIYFQNRLPAEPTAVTVLCYGATGTVIPAGGPLANDASGNLYSNSSAVTISSSGSVSASFTNTLTGPIPAAANSLALYQTIPGWDAISNTTGVLGQNVETAQAFELRRGLSVQSNAQSVNDAVLGTVLALPGVLDAFVADNSTNGTLTLGGVVLAANSLYVAVSGGVAQAIATAIWTKKNPGASYTGTTTETVVDPNPAYDGNGPSYSVSFTVASALPINLTVSIPNTPAVPADATALITSAAVAAFAGTDGLPRASRIGQTVFASRFYPGIVALGAWASNIIEILVGTGTPAAFTQAVNINQISTLGTVTVTLV